MASPLPLPVSSGGGVSEIPSVFSLPSFLPLSLPVEKEFSKEEKTLSIA